MRLSDLHNGERGVIIKVMGHGGFRKRIIEMGFIKGKIVEVLQNAPLQDPVKYKIMGYEVSLRHSEAAKISVISEAEAHELEHDNTLFSDAEVVEAHEHDELPLTEKQMQKVAQKKRRTINVALVGNPNCGKTSLFNFVSGAHERVGNYSGVTVDAKEGTAYFEGYTFNIVDLPGTYSLSAYSPEELYVRRQIVEHTPDIIINVIDSSNLERNLYLTTQLIDMHIRMICALNMFDETEQRGDKIDFGRLGQLLGVPMVPTVFKNGRGVDLLFHIIINMYEGLDYIDEEGNLDPEVAKEIREWHKEYDKAGLAIEHEENFATEEGKPQRNVFRHIHINHGQYIEAGIADIQKELKKNDDTRLLYSTRYLAIKLLENDSKVQEYAQQLPNADAIMSAVKHAANEVLKYTNEDSETAIMDAKYGFIHGALQEARYETGKKKDTYQTTHMIDALITHRWLGFPIFIFIIWLMFEATFTIGQYPMDWIDMFVAWLGGTVKHVMPDGFIKDMLADGIISGVGAVIVFLPQILILYAFISFMEDCGYMARAAFIMDKLMHKMGLHGKSFIPLIMGFGCNVPAIMACRTIESRRSRFITMLILPLMSCSARLPIYIMIVGTFFAAQYRSTVLISLYCIGIILAILMSRLLSRFVVKGDDTPFVMELPPYRFPTWKAIARHTWEKGKQYLKKMGGVILVASIVVWALGYFPHNDNLTAKQQQEQSYIGQMGKAIEPIFNPLGFNWKLDVGIVSGVVAKEVVASSMGVLYSDDDSFADDDNFTAENNSKYERLRAQMESDGITPLTAISFLLFVLIYFPCIAVISAIRGETGRWRWALFTAGYTTMLAWIVAAVGYQIGNFLI